MKIRDQKTTLPATRGRGAGLCAPKKLKKKLKQTELWTD